MDSFSNPIQWILGCLLILSSLGIVLARKPVYASLSFLVTLLTLSAVYLQLSAEFIAMMQILVYAGAILVIFMFVIILFQDAHEHMKSFKPKNSPVFLLITGIAFVLSLIFFGSRLVNFSPSTVKLSADFGTVQALGQALYVDFFFPFEAVILLFLIAIVGAVYVGRKVA